MLGGYWLTLGHNLFINNKQNSLLRACLQVSHYMDFWESLGTLAECMGILANLGPQTFSLIINEIPLLEVYLRVPHYMDFWGGFRTLAECLGGTG